MNEIKDNNYVVGMIGLGTMGRNLLLNMATHGYAVAGYDKNADQVVQLEKEGEKLDVKGFLSLKELINSLEKPRTVMMLVPAGRIVDQVIQEVLPLLEEGDIIIDGGNSHFTDTNRRVDELKKSGCHFFGTGISGGEEGARHGPSIMPGGDEAAYKVVQPIFEAIAAQVNGEPCVTYVGPGASGHFVKMVHNGIEYALMQLLAETYEILKKGLHLDNNAIHTIFKRWNEGKLGSYLLEITTNIFDVKEPGTNHLLLDNIQDVAKAKGTGKWTSQIAMDLVLPIPSVDTAVSMRDLSKYKPLRTQMSSFYISPSSKELLSENADEFVKKLEEAFYGCMIIAYAQGFHLLSKASEGYGYELTLDGLAKIWRGGCIIRSEFLTVISDAFQRDPLLPHLLLDKAVQSLLIKSLPEMRDVVTKAINDGLAAPIYASSISYFDTLRSEHMPANLIQAQRDYFGAHTYERTDQKGIFHTHWER